jgi:hypothetical protein
VLSAGGAVHPLDAVEHQQSATPLWRACGEAAEPARTPYALARQGQPVGAQRLSCPASRGGAGYIDATGG